MKVKMLVSITGTRDGEPWPERGGVADLPEGEAADMISGGLAVSLSGGGDETIPAKPAKAKPRKATAPTATETR